MTQLLKFKKAISIMLVFAMILCFTAGCRQVDDDEYISYYEVIEDDVDDGSEAQDADESDKTPDKDDAGNKDTTSNKDSSTNKDTSSKNDSKEDTKTEVSNVNKNLKGTTLKILWWQPFMDSEKKVIEQFEKETGIKVEYKNTTNAGTYGELISASLAAKEGYDIAMFNNIDFPGRPVSYFQPLNDIKSFDLSDSAWDKDVMDAQKINGKYYGVNINGSNHTEYICMYFNETMFKDRGVKTPREYYEEGNWNWDTFVDCAKAMTYKENGVQIYGYANRGSSYLTYWTTAQGNDFIKYDGKKFTSNLSNSNLLDTIKFVNELGSKLKVADPNNTYGIPDFRESKAAMHSSITYAMRKDSSTKFNQMTDKIDAVPFPMPKGQKEFAIVDSTLFGVLKGAKNPEAASVFLRYFLDPKNYDMSANFINKNMEKTFNALSKMDKKVSISQGVVNHAALVDFGNVCHNIALTNPEQVTAKVKSYASNFDIAVKKANKTIQ